MELAISGFGLDGKANSSQFRRQMKVKNGGGQREGIYFQKNSEQ
jgi:hypothetical protein